MSPRLRNSSPRRWPFWLLFAAWFCANSPQAAVLAALNWMEHARHFTHQQRLEREVAQLLGGKAKAAATARLAQKESAPARAHPLAVPPDAVLKKIELGEPAEVMRGTLPRRANAFAWREVRVPASPAREPLTEPPRRRV